MLQDVFLDAVTDTAKLLPFLFLTYLLMEYIERKTSEKSVQKLRTTGRLGPLFGGLVGAVPQCGFSAAAASLYSGGVITVGTLLAVFLSTSDEMLPLLISEAVNAGTILKIVMIKALLGILTGFAADAFVKTLGLHRTQHHIHDLCEQEHCGCDEEEGSIVRAALVHTLHIALFIFIFSVVIGLAVHYIGEDRMAAFLSDRTLAGVFLSSLIGLIPNCASSVMITELYLKGIMGAGQMMAGLMVSAGVGLLVLFRTNSRYTKDNLKILAALYCSGAFWGIMIELLGVTF